MGKAATEVATLPKNAVATLDESLLAQFRDDAGKGLEGASQDDFAMPFIKLIQALSPQRKKSDANYIPEAEEGDIINSVNGELYAGSDGIRVVPIAFTKKYLEYRKRKDGGGFVAAYDSKEDGLANMQDGNELVDTANHFVLYQDSTGKWKPACISMSSSKLKASRKWNSLVADVTIPGTSLTAPSYAKVYLVRSVEETNRRNEKYFNYAVAAESWTPKDVYSIAKQAASRIGSGEIQADFKQGEDVVIEEDTGRPNF